MPLLKVTLKSVEKAPGGGYLIYARSVPSDRLLHWTTSKGGFCKGQELSFTYREILPSGEILGVRNPVQAALTVESEGLGTDACRRLILFQKEGKSKGRLALPGGYEVSIDRRSWFLVYRRGEKQRLISFCQPQEVLEWVKTQPTQS